MFLWKEFGKEIDKWTGARASKKNKANLWIYCLALQCVTELVSEYRCSVYGVTDGR